MTTQTSTATTAQIEDINKQIDAIRRKIDDLPTSAEVAKSGPFAFLTQRPGTLIIIGISIGVLAVAVVVWLVTRKK